VTIKPIRSAADHAAALSRLEAIFDAVPGTPEADEAEVIATLVQLYEERHFPIDLPSPVAAIRFRMDQQGLKAKDLIPFIGSASKVSEVLSGRRRLSLAMIRNLIRGLGIPAHILLQVPTSRESAMGAWAPRRGQREPEAMLREDREGPRTRPAESQI
jgi:HTH-type transcriptional regulator/antitoxin HigA